MGTNYYLRKNICKCCDRYDELHIGKSSAGWNFSLRVHSDEGLSTLDDWIQEFKKGKIFNEYEREVREEEMISIITERGEYTPKGIKLRSHVELLGNGLRVKRGEGSWDYCDYEFS